MARCTPLLVLLVACVAVTVAGRMGTKSVMDMGSMVACTTGLSGWFAAYRKYDGYGCYCGKGGGGTPLDDTDKCCSVHDKCYGDAPCDPSKIYGVDYKYVSANCKKADASITCTAGQAECAAAMCECDKKIALCFKKHKGSYNTAYHNYYQKKC